MVCHNLGDSGKLLWLKTFFSLLQKKSSELSFPSLVHPMLLGAFVEEKEAKKLRFYVLELERALTFRALSLAMLQALR